MKKSLHKWLITTFCCLLVGQLQAAQEVSKNIHRNYKVTPATKISVDNKFGRVHVNTWSKNEVELEVNISAKGRSDERSNEILNAIVVDLTDDNPSDYLGFETKIGQIRGNASYNIDYTISMPSSNALELANSFGDVYLQNLSGELDLTVKYGQLIAEKLTGDVELHLDFGKGESDIGFLSKGDFDIRYSKLKIEGAGQLDLTSQFSSVQLGKTGSLEIDGKYGDFKVDEVDRFEGNLEFSGLTLGKLNNSMVLDSKHGNGLNVDKIGQQFTLIDLTNDFSSVTLNIPKGVNTALELAIKFGELRTNGSNFNFTTVKKENTYSEYKGYIGSSKGSAKIVADTKYGNVVLKVED